MTKLLLGKPVAESVFERIKKNTAKKQITLATVGLCSPQWQQYVGSIKKSAEKCGIVVEDIVVSESAQELSAQIAQLSARSDVSGVLVQQPLPKQLAGCVNLLDPAKDVDCLTESSVAKLYKGEDCLLPATPSAVIMLLDFYGINLTGKNVVIIGRGNAVGKPLALMMLKRNATVTVCHTKTQNLHEICKRADIIVSACGVAGLVTKDFVTPNTVVVDVGLSFVDGKTRGDVAEEVQQIVAAVSPVPGGVGPITRAALFENLLRAAKCDDN